MSDLNDELRSYINHCMNTGQEQVAHLVSRAQDELTRLRAEHDALVERLRGLPRVWRALSAMYEECAADLERELPPVTNPDDPIHDKRRQDAEELQADRRDALRELDDAVNGCDED